MPKDELLRFRVTAEEKALIEGAAQRDGVPVSQWMVGTLVTAAQGYSRAATNPPAPAPVKVLTAAQVRKRFPAPKPEKGSALGHGPHCQCLACRGRAS